MANIIKSYPEELTKTQKYFLTMNPITVKMAECEGQVLDIEAWAIYTDEDFQTGEEKEVLAILTKEGETVATISSTFKREFLSIVDIFGDELEKIKVLSGKSKNGRTYVTCVYVK